jgi:long-chain acyl-CoA synthetase
MEVTRLFDVIEYQLAQYPQSDMLAAKVKGEWKRYSTSEVNEIVWNLARGLYAAGIREEQKVAIISPNRPEWNFLDFAIQRIGAISVPVYPTVTIEDYRYIFQDAEVKMVFVADQEIYDKALAAFPHKELIYSFNNLAEVPHWTSLSERAKEVPTETVIALSQKVKPENLLTLIYTSGTTGTPKGVMLTHSNLVSNYKACIPLMPVNETHRALSFLPMCHIYERMLVHLYMAMGVSVYYAESLETIGDNLKEVQPHIFTTVPRLLEKVYDKIVAKGSELTGIKRALFFWALNLGLRYEIHKPMGPFYDVQLWLANKLIFNKWRAALGGNVMAVVSGSAALQARLARVFWAAKIPVMEGYGLTETSPVISVNRCDRKDNRIGTVGPVIEGVEVKIAPDGEILTRGPHIMLGYYKKPEQTAEVIDAEGWFHTGDIGEFIEKRYLKITDRKKEIFKTSGGKYIAPQLMENKFKESRVIEQIMVVGDGRKFPAALIVPDFAGLKAWCQIKDIAYTTDAEMILKPEILDKFQKEMDQLNENFAQYEKIKKFTLLPKLWTIDSGELTPTLKLKRKQILAKYVDQLEKMYHE